MKSFAIFFTAALLLMYAPVCTRKDKGTFKLNEPVKAPVGIALIDANRLLSIQILNAKVTLIDTAGQVVTSNNLSFSSLDIKGGALSLALKKAAKFSTTDPYHFAIKVESPGYSTTFRSILIYEDSAQYVPVFMTKTDDPAVGMSGFIGNVAIAGSTVTSNVTLVPTKRNKQDRQVSVTIPAGTIMLNNGKPLRQDAQNISYNFSYASPGSVNALRTFPGGSGGTLITQAVDSIGRPVATPQSPLFFISNGWMTLEINAGSEKVTEFSKPVSLLMPVEATSINPATLKPYNVGERIDIWSLSDRNVWKREGSAQVTPSADGLVAVFGISHLSTWNLDNAAPKCVSNAVIPVSNTSGAAVDAWCEVVGNQSGLPFSLLIGDNLVHFNTGSSTHTLKNIPSMGGLTFLAYDNSTAPGATRASSSFSCGVTPPTLNLTALPGYSSVKLEFQYLVGGSRIPICKNSVFFKPGADCTFSGTGWIYGGILIVPAGTSVGTTTMFKTGGAFSSTCIHLFYGKSTSSATTISLPIDFTVDFLQTDGLPHDATFASRGGITYQYIMGSNTFQITIPADDLEISSCAS